MLDIGESAKVLEVGEPAHTLEVGECSHILQVGEGPASLSQGTVSYSDFSESSGTETADSFSSNDSRGEAFTPNTPIQAMSTRNTKRPDPEPESSSSSESEGDVVDLTQTAVPPIAVGLDPGSQVEALDVAPEPESAVLGPKDKISSTPSSPTPQDPKSCERADWKQYLEGLKGPNSSTQNRPGTTEEAPQLSPEREVPNMSESKKSSTHEKSTSSNAPAGEAPKTPDANAEKKVTAPSHEGIITDSDTDEDVVEIQSSPKKQR